MHILTAAQPGTTHATLIKDERESALDHFGAEPERLAGDFGEQAGAVVIDGAAGDLVAVG